MTPHLTEILKELRLSKKKKALKTGKPFNKRVFAERGKVFSRGALGNALKECLKRAGLRKIRIHDLRHSYATIRLLKGHNIGDVSYQLGHSDISITYNVYGHWIPGKFKSEIDELDTQPNATQAQPKEKAKDKE